MRHLLEVLRKDFEEPVNIPTSSTELERGENDVYGTLLPHLQSGGKQVETKEDDDLLPYASLIKYCDTPDLLSAFTTLRSPERTTQPLKPSQKDKDGNMQERLNEQLTDNTKISEESFHQNKMDTTAANREINDTNNYTSVINDKGSREDQAEVAYDGQSTELENLGRNLSESLHISINSDFNNANTGNEQPTNTAAAVSDDEF